MPKVTYFQTPTDRLRQLVFGSSAKRTSIPVVSKATGIDAKTLYRWRQRPELIRVGALGQIGEELGWSDDKWNQVFDAIRKGRVKR